MTARRSSPLLLLLFALVALPTRAAELPALPFPDADELKSFSDYADRRMATRPSAGMSFGFVHAGKRWTAAHGYRDLDDKLPATPTTSYRMASVTKSFTSVAAASLAEEGKLDLDAPIRRYLKWWPKKRWPVTTRHLLGHLAGIRHYVNPRKESHIKVRMDAFESVSLFKHRPLEYRPGHAYLYSSYGYNLAGAVLEAATGKRYDELLQEHVFGPAGMKTAMVEYDPDASIEERALGYRLRGDELRPSERINISSRFAGGGTRASVEDMLSFAAAYMAGELVGDDMRRQIERSMVLKDGMLTDYGMGFAVVPQAGRFVIVHGGGQPETSTLLVLYPAEGFAFAAAANVEGYAEVLHEVKEHVVAHVLGDGTPRVRPTGRDLTHAAWARALNALMSHGVAQYKRWRRTTTTSPAELFSAFDSLRALLDRHRIREQPLDALQAALLADDPVGGSAYPIAGSFMAGTLARVHGPAHLRRYHDDPFAFLADYAAAADKLDLPEAVRLPKRLIDDAATLGAGYRAAVERSAAFHRLDGEARGPLWLLDTFGDAPIVPDYSDELRDAAKEIEDADGRRAALKACLVIYPESAGLLRATADATLDAGNYEAARALYERYAARDAAHPYNRAEALTWAAKARRRQDKKAYRLLLDLAEQARSRVDLR